MQEKYEIELSGKAKEDLKKIVIYIKKNLNEPTIARKYAQLINERIRTLKYIPQRYMIIEDNEIKHLNSNNRFKIIRLIEYTKICFSKLIRVSNCYGFKPLTASYDFKEDKEKSIKLKNIVQKYKDTREKYIKLKIDNFPPL